MIWLDRTWLAPAENLACDEALLDWCDEAGGEVLRFWEAAEHFVVVGYANKAAVEVNLPACAWHRVGVFRRCSGGGTVLQGPGCLNYTLILQIPEHGWLASISGTNQFIMHRHREAMESLLGRAVIVSGHTDLALDGRKFSGNAQRRRRRALLFHGTFLHGFDLALLGKFLNFPSQQPDYRQDRAHGEFVMNLPLSPERLKERLRETWQAEEAPSGWPWPAVQQLAAEKYATEAWNLKF